MVGEARSVVVRLTAETAQYIASMQAAGTMTAGAMTKAEAATMKQSVAVDTLGSKAGKLGLVAAVGLGAMGKAAMDWESQFAGVEKTVDGTTAELAELEGGLRSLAKSMPATHEEIAGVAEAAGQLGVAREDVVDFTETMVQLGETTNLSAQDAATSIAQMANVMGTAPDKIDNVGASLVALGNDGASTERQIIEMAQRISGAGAQIGLVESDILAIANAAASMGIEVEAGGSAISKVFIEMAKATAQGGEDLDAFAEVAGVSADEFTRAFKEDPASAFASFTEGLDRIKASGGDVFTTLDQLGLSDTRVSRALLSMASSGDLLRDSLDLGAESFAENTALTDEYGKRLDTTASQVQIAWNQIKDAGISAGTELLPVIAKVATVVGTMADAFGSLPQPVKSSLTGLLGITALLGGGLWFGSKVVGGVTSTRVALDALSSSSPRAARGLSLVAKAGGALAALEVGAAIIDTLRESAKGAAPDVAELNAALSAVDATALKDALGGDLTDLLEAADSSTFEDLGSDIGGYVDSMGLAGDAIDAFVPGLHVQQDAADKTSEALGALDQALASLAATEGPERAISALKTLAKTEGLTSNELSTLTDLLPAYRAAIGDAAGGTDEAVSAFDLLEDAIFRLSGGPEKLAGQEKFLDQFFKTGADGAVEFAEDIDDAAASVDGLSAAMNQLSGFLDRADAMRAYGEAIKETTKALKDGFDPKDVEVIQGIGREIVGVAESLAKKPAQQRSFLQQAKNDLEAFIESNPKAKAALSDLLKYVNRGLDALDNKKAEPKVDADTGGFDRDEASVRRRHKALDFLKANPKVDLNDAAFSSIFRLTAADLAWLDHKIAHPKVDLNAESAISKLYQVKSLLGGLKSKSISVTTYLATVHRPAGGSADGGSIPKDGGPYADRFPYLLAPGEEVISNRHGQADQFRADRAAGRIPGYADGGTAGGFDFRNTYVHGLADGGRVDSYINGAGALDSVFQSWESIALEVAKDWKREVHQRLREATKRTEALREELDTAEEVRDGWRDVMDSLSENVVGKLSSDLFGEGASFESIIETLRDDKTRALEFQQAEQILAGLGLDGDALQALIEQTSPEQLIDFAQNWTADQVDQFERLFNQTQNAQQGAGFTGGELVFGAREDAAAAEVAGLRSDLKKAETREKRLLELAEDADKRWKRMKELAETNPEESGRALARVLDDKSATAARNRS